MAKRVDYQNPNNDLEEVQERRNAQIRAWAKADQEAADSRRGLIETTQDVADDWGALEPDTGEADTVPASADAIAEVAGAEDPEPTPEPTPEPQEPVKEEKKEEPKKTPAKKAAAPAKEASSKE